MSTILPVAYESKYISNKPNGTNRNDSINGACKDPKNMNIEPQFLLQVGKKLSSLHLDRKYVKKRKNVNKLKEYGYLSPNIRGRNNIHSASSFFDFIETKIRLNFLNLDINQGSFGTTYGYIDLITAMQITDRQAILLQAGDQQFIILNYDLIDPTTGLIYYGVIQPNSCGSGKCEWKMKEKPLTHKNIENVFNTCIPPSLLPKSSRNRNAFKLQLKYQKQVEIILRNKEKMKKIIQSTKWTKMYISSRKQNQKRLTYSLTQKTFRQNMENFLDDDNNNNVITMVIFDKDKCEYHVEYGWIITIEGGNNIVISFKYNELTNSIEPTMIHLDKEYIYNQYRLTELDNDKVTAPQCINEFQSSINDLHIGNPDDNRNKLNSFHKEINNLKQELEETKKQINELTIIRESNIGQWLMNINGNNLSEYFNNFMNHGFDSMDVIIHMNDQHLQDIGIHKRGHRMQIIKSINNKINELQQEKQQEQWQCKFGHINNYHCAGCYPHPQPIIKQPTLLQFQCFRCNQVALITPELQKIMTLNPLSYYNNNNNIQNNGYRKNNNIYPTSPQ